MKENLEKLRTETLNGVQHSASVQQLEIFRVSILGRKGKLTEILKNLKNYSLEEKRIFGKMANDLKEELEKAILERGKALQESAFKTIGKDFFDTTLPGTGAGVGSLHPFSKFIDEIEETFIALNFDIVQGPEVEDDFHNFTALNIPSDHPARDTQATLWIKDLPLLLRTQTSTVQIRHMENNRPPFRIVCPGRVYRRDEMDATHSPQFAQFEGMMVDETTNLSHLKGILTLALRRLLHPEIELRFRSSFFPFVEPGLEVDVTCVLCHGKGCSVCKKSGWIEMLGCGMVHPEVLKAGGIDPTRYQGFAFGAGIERLLMIKYKINDIRLFTENDPRFLEQFPLLV